jgi:transcriptional regulator with XRE-family HTH domain
VKSCVKSQIVASLGSRCVKTAAIVPGVKTPKQRGPFGSWLQAERTRRYPTQEAARADMRRLAGLHLGASEFAQWEAGSRIPNEDNPKVQRLYEFFGSRPADLTTTAADASTYEQEHLALLREANRIAERQAVAWETIAAAFSPSAPTSPFGQSVVGLIQAFAAEQGHAPLPLPADHEPSLGR